MARYGTWRPLANNWASQSRMARYDLLIFHTMVGSLGGTDDYFRADGYGGSESHFGVGHDGTCYQWQDTDFRAEANGAANPRAVSVETADVGAGFPAWNTNDGSQVPSWTDSQVNRLVALTVWVCKAHNIPCILVPDSRPERRGVAWHRLGVPGYIVSGGEAWSSARGKACPGTRRIAQIPGIVARAALVLGQGGKSASNPSQPASTRIDRPSISEGDTGDLVVSAQAWFKRMYSYAKDLDLGPRRYGPQTIAVVRQFQSRVGITGPDAIGTIIGPRTWAAMEREGFR